MQCFVAFEINSSISMSDLERRLRNWGLSPVMRNFWNGTIAPSAAPELQPIPDTVRNDLLEAVDAGKDRLLVFFVDGQCSFSTNNLLEG
jgi:hypothetical protein